MNKHPEDYVFGMDKEIQDKWKAKYSSELQTQAIDWIASVINERPEVDDRANFEEWLHDGQVLCRLTNAITKGETDYKNKYRVKKIYTGTSPFSVRGNICAYLKTCRAMGMVDNDLFVSQDLYERDNVVKVIANIFILGAKSRNIKSFQGPWLGNKMASENKREFSEETLIAGKKFIPLQNAGSIAVEKEKGTDAIVMYAKAGEELGKSVGGVSQQNGGSIAVDLGSGTDQIVKYGFVGQDMGKSVGGVSQQNAGSIAVEKEKGTDNIVRYGKVGQDMGKSTGGVSQQNAGSIAVEKELGTDNIVRYGKVGQEMGESVGGVSQINEGSLETDKGKVLDNTSRALN